MKSAFRAPDGFTLEGAFRAARRQHERYKCADGHRIRFAPRAQTAYIIHRPARILYPFSSAAQTACECPGNVSDIKAFRSAAQTASVYRMQERSLQCGGYMSTA